MARWAERTDRLYDVEAEFYDALSGSYTEDIELIRAVARETGGPILELMSGTGRVLLALAREGYEIWGLDVNEAIVGRAKANLSRERQEVVARVHLVAADARSFALDRKFPLILITYGSFLHLLEEQDREGCLASVVEHLDSDGVFVLAIENFQPKQLGISSRLGTITRVLRSGIVGRLRDRRHQVPDATGIMRVLLNFLELWLLRHPRGQVGRVRLVSASPSEDLLCVEFETLDLKARRSTRDELYIVIGERGVTVKRGTTSLAMISRKDMAALLDRSGLAIVRLMGGYDGGPFESDSPIQVYVCKKKLVASDLEHTHPRNQTSTVLDRGIH